MTQSKSFRITLLLATAFYLPLHAQEVRVERDELISIGDQSIKFINYVGPHEFINTTDQIRGIGRFLGSGITLQASGKISIAGKYELVHIVEPNIVEGFDADVFIIGDNGAVDHINNLRTIIAGYLERVYGFFGRDAYLIAEFVTYYNAVYRNDMEMAKERYKEPVVSFLNSDKLGLDTHYSNWAGKTQMLIPLSVVFDADVSINAGAITDDEVIEEMRKEEDMGLDSRRDMVELREREIAKAQEKLDKRRGELESEHKSISEELGVIEEREAAGEKPGSEAKKQVEKSKSSIEKAIEELEKLQKDVDKRTEEVLEMRDDISEDENRRIAAETEDIFTSATLIEPLWFLTVDNAGDGIPYGRIVKYNLKDRKLLAVSKVTAVRGRSMAILPESIIVIAGRRASNSKVRLMLLDRNTLEEISVGKHDIFPGSLMMVKGGDIYLVTTEKGEWRLGKFDTALNRTAISELAIEPWTSISCDETSVYVQRAEGGFLKLSSATLKEESRLP